MYAYESLNHTIDYDGWDDAYEKTARIVTGKYCQLWLAEVCRLNNIPHKKDRSSPYISDAGDLEINGWNIDSKGSAAPGFEGQVTKHHDDPGNTIDVYAFFRTDRSLSYIEPLGFIRCENLLKVAQKVNKGEKIPGIDVEQKFATYSYFVDLSRLGDFETVISWMAKNPKTKLDATG